MKVFLTIIAIALVLVIAFVTLVIANEGEDTVLASQESPSPSVVSQSPTPSITPSPSPSPSPSVEPSPVGPVNPLTGLPADEAVISNRPYAIMINNIRAAQPQIGISKADLIYEILVEGGITRMMAVFQDVSGAGEIGSIRSARPYFVDIALGLDALYIHAGGSPDAYTELANTGIFHLDGVNGKKQDIFFRDPQRKATMGSVHSLVTTDELILKYMPIYKVDMAHKDGYTCNMTFADTAVPNNGTAAQSVTAHFSASKTTSFTYSADSGLYDVSQYGSAYVDGNDDTKISVANVLILQTSIQIISGDDEGRIDVAVTGSGNGKFFCGGKYVDITWSRKSNTDQFTFKMADGSDVTFCKGKSYICIVSKNDKIDIK